MRDIRAEKNPRWNGGISEYQNHSLLKKVRIDKLKSIYEKCEICGLRAKIVHHKDWETKNHNIFNLVGLCHSCHRQIHDKKNGGRKTSRYIRSFGMTLENISYITGLGVQTVKQWANDEKRKKVLVYAINHPKLAQKIVKEIYYKHPKNISKNLIMEEE